MMHIAPIIYFTDTRPALHVAIDRDANLLDIWVQPKIASGAIVARDITVTMGGPHLDGSILHLNAQGLLLVAAWIAIEYDPRSLDTFDRKLRSIVRDSGQLNEMLTAIRQLFGRRKAVGDQSYYAGRVAEQLTAATPEHRDGIAAALATVCAGSRAH